jgi:serine/threonine protein kinase
MAIPEKIGKYEISEQIGVGGFGAVYRARDPFIKRTVAVKTCALNDEEIRNRFFREAELAGNLHHRNITTIYDFGLENGIPYIVQEFLTGEDLDKLIKRGEVLSVARKLEILMSVCDGLAYAHRSSVIHRDIKPANIRILDDGAVKIMDFGIAKSLLSESSLTQTGITLGTSAYLAPEQIRGEPLDQRTDVFALGILAYELLTYRKPFRGEHLSTVLYRILNETPEPVHEASPEVPPALSAIVARAMEKEIDGRYPSMEAFKLDLQNVYREATGSSSRFATEPRLTGAPRPTAAPVDPDQTIATPSKGMMVGQMGHITPPSGAVARVPARASTPPVASPRASAPPGLELVDFRDPSQKPASSRPTTAAPAAPARRSHSVAIGSAIIAVLAVAGALIFLARPRTTVPPAARIAPPPAVPTAPLVFPTPQLGHEPAGTAPGSSAPAAARVPPAPAAVPTAAPVAAAAPPPVENAAPAKPARRYRIQITSLPMSTLYVDGKKIGASIPARTLELPEGEHTARFEHPDFAAGEKRFEARAGAAPVVYRFPVGYLVIDAPAWAGANVLIDMKFRGVLAGEKTFPLKSGPHKVTLSREGVAPITADVIVPEGDRKTWTPPPPASRPETASSSS